MVELVLMKLCNALAVVALMAAPQMTAATLPSAFQAEDNTVVEVAPSGTTSVSFGSPGLLVTAQITTRIQLETGLAPNVVTACTRSRVPCSLVSQIELRVGKQEVFVPRSIVLQLADVDRAKLHRNGSGRLELILECGDASEAYSARVFFNSQRVTQLDIIDGEGDALAERTVFPDLSHLFND